MSAKEDSMRIRRKLRNLPEKLVQAMTNANDENADDLAGVARTLVRQGATGRARAAIRAFSFGREGAVVDFGPLSKILEGGTKQRTTKDGKNRGRSPAFPFVNPALKATKARRRKRIRDAVRKSIRDG
ncbi:MAG: hypothetical protein AAGF30_00370 [Pseudomonadota bacterium]